MDFEYWLLNYCFPQEYYFDPPLEGIGPLNRFQHNTGKGKDRLNTYLGDDDEETYTFMTNTLDYAGRYIDKYKKRPEEVQAPLELIKKIKKLKGDFNKKYYWYTIVPQERLPYNAEYLRKINDFCVDLFEKSAKKWFNEVWWVIESGKHENNPNLHVHALVEFKSSKHFRRDMLRKWNKYIPEGQYNITWERAIDMKSIDKEEYFKDKLDYMTNDLKGTHENFTDLGLRGRYSSTDF